MNDVGKVRSALLGVLDAVQDASPGSAVEAATRRVGEALWASSVSFRIPDLSGRLLVGRTRIELSEGFSGRPPGLDADREHDARDSTTVVPLDGGPAHEALRRQAVQVLPPDDTAPADPWTVLAPVSERAAPVLDGRNGSRRRQSPSPPGSSGAWSCRPAC